MFLGYGGKNLEGGTKMIDVQKTWYQATKVDK